MKVASNKDDKTYSEPFVKNRMFEIFGDKYELLFHTNIQSPNKEPSLNIEFQLHPPCSAAGAVRPKLRFYPRPELGSDINPKAAILAKNRAARKLFLATANYCNNATQI